MDDPDHPRLARGAIAPVVTELNPGEHMPNPISLSNITVAIENTVAALNDLTTLAPDAERERDNLVLFLEGLSKIVQAKADCPAESYIPRWAPASGSSS